jgi:hypothetical protein
VGGLLGLTLLMDLAGAGCVVAGILSDGPQSPVLIGIGAALLVSGSVIMLVGARTGRLRGARRLMTEGLALPATVLAMRETGVTINNSPVFGFQLEIRREGHPPYPVTVRQQVPRMFVGAVLPGGTVMVRQDPEHPDRVAIDWSEPPGPRHVTITPENLAEALHTVPPEQRLRPDDVLARGRRGIATVVSARTLGTLEDLNLAEMEHDPGDEMFVFELEVKLPGRDPYLATVIHGVPVRLIGRVGPGLELPVAADREDPEHRVAIVWDEV